MTSAIDRQRKTQNGAEKKRLAPAAYWLREAMQEVERDIEKIKAGRSGLLRSYSVEGLLAELH